MLIVVIVAAVIVAAVVVAVVGGTGLLDESCNEATGELRYNLEGNISYLLTLSLVQKTTDATATRVSSLVTAVVVRVSRGLISIIAVASLAPEAGRLAAIVVISTAVSTVAAVLVSPRARVVATAVIVLVRSVVVIVTKVRALVSTIVVVGIVVVRHLDG